MKRVVPSLTVVALLSISFPALGSPQAGQKQETSGDAPGPLATAAQRFLGTEDEVPAFTVVFGGIKHGSSVALGPAVGHTFAHGGTVQARAEYSVRHYKLLQVEYRTRPLWSGRARVTTRIRWQDAPEVPIYRLGIDSPDRRALYSERRTEWRARLIAAPTRVTRFAAGAGLERYRVGGGRLDTEEDEALEFVPDLPGLATNSRFVHVFASGGIDTRPSPGYSRRGSVIQVGLHHFDDITTGRYSFSQVIPELLTKMPVSNGTSVIELRSRAWLSGRSSSEHMPFFLMPYLGGGDFLVAFPNYRFRDANAVQVSASYSRAVHKYADVGGFAEAGTVGARIADLRFATLEPVFGVSLVVHSEKDTFLRLRLGRSREYWGVAIAFSPRASAVF